PLPWRLITDSSHAARMTDLPWSLIAPSSHSPRGRPLRFRLITASSHAARMTDLPWRLIAPSSRRPCVRPARPSASPRPLAVEVALEVADHLGRLIVRIPTRLG